MYTSGWCRARRAQRSGRDRREHSAAGTGRRAAGYMVRGASRWRQVQAERSARCGRRPARRM